MLELERHCFEPPMVFMNNTTSENLILSCHISRPHSFRWIFGSELRKKKKWVASKSVTNFDRIGFK